MKNDIKPTKTERRILIKEASAKLKPMAEWMDLKNWRLVKKVQAILDSAKQCPTCTQTISANKTACLACATVAAESLPLAA